MPTRRGRAGFAGAAALTRARVALPEVEGVPLAVLARCEPAVRRNRRLLAGLAAELAHLRDRRLDVRCVEVEVRVTALLRAHQRSACFVADLRHAVLELLRHRRPELPSEDAAPELLRPLDIGCRDLDVNDISCHRLRSFLLRLKGRECTA